MQLIHSRYHSTKCKAQSPAFNSIVGNMDEHVMDMPSQLCSLTTFLFNIQWQRNIDDQLTLVYLHDCVVWGSYSDKGHARVAKVIDRIETG